MKDWMRAIGLAALGAAVAAMAPDGRPRRRRTREDAGDGLADDLPKASGAGRKRRLLRLAALFAVFLAVLGIGGFLTAASGIIPIKASSGHWKITEWFLKFSMHRSFSTHSLGIEVPPLKDPVLVLRGAGAYETGCRPCHGSPDLPHPRVAQAMTPRAPYLPPVVSEWEPAELFSLVKHGVKLTGMPAWPAQERDDEVWALVAFLLEMRELDAAGYRRLVHGPVPEESGGAPIQGLLDPQSLPQAVTRTCARCHGADGRGRGLGAFPRLAGQSPVYLENALRAYASGRRHSGIMEPIAAGLDAGEIRALARYYSGRGAGRGGAAPARPVPSPAQETAAAVERGRSIAQQGIPQARVPSCADCHGPGNRNPAYPRLAGQYPEYIVQQLELFRRRQRGGSAFAHLMHPVAGRLTPGQMRDVALYYASLEGDPP